MSGSGPETPGAGPHIAQSTIDRESEDDIAEFMLLAASLAGGSSAMTGNWSWTQNPLAKSRSRIFRIDLRSGPAGSLAEPWPLLGGLEAEVRSGVLPNRLMVTGASQPEGLAGILVMRGWKCFYSQTAMAVDPATLAPAAPDPRVDQLRDTAALADWVDVANRGFNRKEGPELYLRLFADGRIRFFGLRAEGRMASSILIFRRGELAGLHTIATPPEMRGRGYATAVTAHALGLLRDEGAKLVVLQASPLGRPVYERLGFSAGSPITQWELG